MNVSELIKKKKHGEAHSADEINWLIQNYSRGEVPDYQMSAWAMAVYFRGMNNDEIAALTLAMKNSGKTFEFSHLNRPRIDKHSTGGVGDKTTLIIGPIMAAAGVAVPMIAGRGLGHTGGTIDKLHSLPGFRLDLSQAEFQSIIEKSHFALIGQTDDICPADKKFYALRDVTSTVDSLPLICGSIMSKKLAENLTGLVLDVKFGSGAFMKSIAEAIELAQLLKSTGEKNGLQVTSIISNMNEPLGRFIGNSVEVFECVEIMSGKTFEDNGVDYYAPTRELSLVLASHMLLLANKVTTVEHGYQLATQILKSGQALDEFNKLLKRQGPSSYDQLPRAKYSSEIKPSRGGRLIKINTEGVGLAAIELGAGRKKTSDTIDYTAGIEVMCRTGQLIDTTKPIFRIFANSNSNFKAVEDLLISALEVSSDLALTPEPLPLIAKVLT